MLSEHIRETDVKQAELLGDLLDEYMQTMAAARHWIINIWTPEDVLVVRKDLNAEQAWQVLQYLDDHYTHVESFDDLAFNVAEDSFGLPGDDMEEDS
jgi:hypothetical protein